MLPAVIKVILQGHEAHSSLSPVSPFPEQVPADQKARKQASNKDHQRIMIHNQYKTCMITNHALIVHIYLH